MTALLRGRRLTLLDEPELIKRIEKAGFFIYSWFLATQ
jgi:hypothetical protein